MRSNLVNIAVKLLHETEAAYLVHDGITQAWVPKSQCELYAHGIGTRHETRHELTMPEWLAKEKGFI